MGEAGGTNFGRATYCSRFLDKRVRAWDMWKECTEEVPQGCEGWVSLVVISKQGQQIVLCHSRRNANVRLGGDRATRGTATTAQCLGELARDKQ